MIVCMAGASGAMAQALQKVRSTQSVATFDFMAVDYAKLAGLFAAEGLDVDQIATRGAGPDLGALVSGDVEFNLSPGVNQINALIGNRDIITVANIVNRSMIGVVVSKAVMEKRGISPSAPLAERAKVMAGLKMGMTQPGALTDRQLRHLARIAGVQEGAITIVSLGGAAGVVAAFEKGDVDGYAIATPFDRIQVAKGRAVMLLDNTRGDDPSIDPFMMTDIHTTRKYASANPETVRKFVRALRRATTELDKRSVEEIRTVVQPAFANVPQDVMVIGITALKKALNTTGMVTQDMVNKTLALDSRKDVTPERLFATFDPSYLK
jgi:ABC-type nitrate/sulfonate/bicarbonate transport system substrate-binding protein